MSKIFLLCFAHHLPSKPVVFTDDYWSWLPGSQACSTEDLLLHVPCHSTYQHFRRGRSGQQVTTLFSWYTKYRRSMEVLQLGFMELSHPSHFLSHSWVCVAYFAFEVSFAAWWSQGIWHCLCQERPCRLDQLSSTPFYSKVICRYSQYVSNLRVHKIQQLGILVCLASGNPDRFHGPSAVIDPRCAQWDSWRNSCDRSRLFAEDRDLVEPENEWLKNRDTTKNPWNTHEAAGFGCFGQSNRLRDASWGTPSNISEFEILNVRTRCWSLYPKGVDQFLIVPDVVGAGSNRIWFYSRGWC